ncbi:MAG: hypothetical protein AAGA92_14535 [Planctomycetota bacterium]
MQSRTASVLLAAALAALLCQPASAHFTWLASDEEGHAMLYFSEAPTDQEYKIPDAIANAEVFAVGKGDAPRQLNLETVDEETFVGRKSAEPVKTVAFANVVYGNYHGTLLSYYAKHFPGKAAGWHHAKPVKQLKLDAQLARTKKGLKLTALWQGEPLADAKATMLLPNGENLEAKTDAEGVAEFTTEAEGLVGILFGYTDTEAKGESGGEPYESASHYCTVTCRLTAPEPEPEDVSDLTPLPMGLASFGGAVADGWLYAYSGHTGKAHDHSAANLSQGFHRLSLTDPTDWQTLPMQQPLQGLALVPHGGKLYRVGGLDAQNPTIDDEEELHSVDSFASFDPATNEWTDLAPLPAPRSSHDAVVIGDKLYVVGGWTLEGPSHGDWLADALVYDLADPESGWQALPEQPFQRRALAAGHADGKLYVLCGMDSSDSISREVDVFDPSTKEWSKGPEMPGKGMEGFGVSAWNAGGRLYLSGFGGKVYRLTEAGDGWEAVAELRTRRFFHRLLPHPDGRLIALAGASMIGHLTGAELLVVKGHKVPENTSASAGL